MQDWLYELVSGATEVMENAEYDNKIREAGGSDYLRLSKLTREQLENLRKDIPLCSLYVDDYQNRYNIDPNQVCMFFDGYADYLSEIMAENNIDDDAFFENLDEYDNIDTLSSWHDIVFGCF